MTQNHTESCPVAASLNEFGDMWTLLIVREALHGASRFTDFRANTGIAKNLLTNRLNRMVDSGILEKRDVGTSGTRHEYHLSSKGRALAPIMAAVTQWGNEWVYGKGKEPIKLIDRKTGNSIAPLAPQDCDGNQIAWKNVVTSTRA